MKRFFTATVLLTAVLLSLAPAYAQPIRAYVSEFSTPSDSSDLKGTLQTLLSTRLAQDGITAATSPAEADVVVSGTYTHIGKMFSLDATARLVRGETLGSAYEQGESQDALIPALGKVAAKLRAEILKGFAASAVPVAPKPEKIEKNAAEEAPISLSQRLTGAKRGLAPGAPDAGAMTFLVAERNAVELWRHDGALKKTAEEKIPRSLNVIAIDTLLQGDKAMVFVTIVEDDSALSRVYEQSGGKLRLVAKDIPYLFRTIALCGGEQKLYVQELGRDKEYFYGDVHEALFDQGKVRLKEAIKMPRFGNILNFNRFRDAEGKSYTLVFSEGGYLIVYTDKGEEIWRSSDKFGGSETFFERRDLEYERLMGTNARKRFVDQRVVVTPKGEVLVPQNAGFFVVGDARYYSNFSVVSLIWNGSSLEERWRSKKSQNYLADFFFEPATKQLELLEVVQREGIFGKGGSAIRALQLP